MWTMTERAIVLPGLLFLVSVTRSTAQVPAGNEFRVNSTTTFAQKQPTAAMVANGDFVIAWAHRTLPDYDIAAQRFDAGGARLGGEFGMRVVYTTPGGPRPSPYEWLPLAELLECADVVSLHCPLLPETRHLIGREELRAMRRDAFLVNTARGPIVDEDALVDGLAGGEIAGAALDVFEHEPAVHEGLLGLDNVVLTPHLGSATDETRTAMGMLCVSALKSVLLEGRVPENVVNQQAVSSLS